MPALVIGEHTFECKPSLPQWQLMKLASAMKSSDPMTQMAGMHDFVLAVVLSADRDRFVAAMDALDEDADDPLEQLNEAIGNLMVSYAAPAKGAASARPTRRSSASPSTPSSTTGTSRVVHLQRGTVRTEETPSSPGHSAAS